MQITSSAETCVIVSPLAIDEAEMELELTFNQIFNALHLVHFTAEQLVEAASDGEVPLARISEATDARCNMFAKVC